MSDDKPPKSFDDLDARLRAAREARDRPRRRDEGDSAGPMGGLGIAFRIGVEMVAALIVGVGIGLLLDKWLGTAPWFLVVFFFVGSAAGVLNVYRAASNLGADPDPPRDDDDRQDSNDRAGRRSGDTK